jgi:hypothetical protein
VRQTANRFERNANTKRNKNEGRHIENWDVARETLFPFQEFNTNHKVLLHESNPLLQNAAHFARDGILIGGTEVNVIHWENTGFLSGNIGTAEPLGVILLKNTQRVAEGDGDLVLTVWGEVGNSCANAKWSEILDVKQIYSIVNFARKVNPNQRK